MNYYVWTNGYENMGIVKANSLAEARHKVVLSQGECRSLNALDEENFDGYDVVILVS